MKNVRKCSVLFRATPTSRLFTLRDFRVGNSKIDVTALSTALVREREQSAGPGARPIFSNVTTFGWFGAYSNQVILAKDATGGLE